jgi:hypothetical protein
VTIPEEMTRSVQATLRRLNNAQRGSFGEHLFAIVAGSRTGASLTALRRNRIDFLFNSVPVDVTTTIRDLERPIRPLSPYKGPRVDGVQYAQVEFSRGGVRVAIECELLGIFDWQRVQHWWATWTSGLHRVQSSANHQSFSPIREKIVAHFAGLGLRARVLYRTIQSEFGDESPANLIPTKAVQNGLTVFVDFAGPLLSEGNIRRIIPFEDVAASSFRVLERTRLHKPKIDLRSIPAECCFATLDELMKSFPHGVR